MKKLSINSCGDTILEVLVSITVVSLILGASYALANQSTQANRRAQERSEALKYTESQLEQLKAFLSNRSNSLAAAGNLFCMKTDGTPTVDGSYNSPLPLSNDFNSDKLGNVYPADCKKGPGSLYHLAIFKDGDTYTATSRWLKLGGGGIEEVKILYRLH